MKKYLTCFGLVLIISISSKAQWVPIPTVFANYIRTYVDSNAINVSLLDTTNANVIGLQNLTITPSSVTDITGIQYFDNLQNLIVNPGIISVPQLPVNLKTLEVRSAILTSFAAALPSGLTALKCYYSDITTCPPLPSTLKTLIFYSCSFLTSIPSLPASLEWLELYSCSAVTSLAPLPGGLLHLSLRYTNGISPFPTLPNSLTWLDISNTNYGNFTSLPPGLVYLDCSHCSNITSLPALPASLDKLYANNCQLTSTSTMPIGMYDLDLSYNPLTTIADLPDTIWSYLQLNNLTSLNSIAGGNIYIGQSINVNYTPGIVNSTFLQRIRNAISLVQDPDGIAIYANHNNSLSIPSFNARIGYLDVSYTPISYVSGQSFWNYPNCGYSSYPDCEGPFTAGTSFNFSHCGINSITNTFQGFFYRDPTYYLVSCGTLNLSYNNITDIDWYFPYVYGNLYLNNNQISNVTKNITAYSADLSNNQITCLPNINIETTLNLTNNPINCLPNIPGLNFVCTPPLTACLAGNSNNCPVNSLAGGVIFDDQNRNGVKNAGEVNLPGYYVMMSPVYFIHQSDSTGHYNFNCETNLNYTIQGISNYPYRQVISPPYNVQYTQNGTIDTVHNIGIYVQPNVNDMYVRICPYTQVRPGFTQRFRVVAKNIGTTVQNGTVEMYFDPALIYQSSNPSGIVTGNKITWNISNLAPLDTTLSTVDFIVPASIPLGSLVRFGAHAVCNFPDSTFYNNHDTVAILAVGSYDPNNKEVSPPVGLTRQEITAGNYLYYTVRFQNTGTASAINVRVEDTLSAALDLSSFEFIDASHSYDWKIENRVLTVYFNNIQLPDSGASEVNSHGFLLFRIRPNPGASVGDQIRNTAYIYFDFNPAIVTNTALTTITTLITRQPKPQYLCSGEPLMLTIQTAPEVIAWSWYKDGLALNITNDTLYIDSSTLNDEGFYTCYVTTIQGLDYASDEVGVEVLDHSIRPQFYFSANNFCLSHGAYLYAIPVASSPNYRYFFYRNGTLVQTSNYGSLYSQNGSFFSEGDTIRCVLSDSLPCTGRVSVYKDTIIHFMTLDTINFSISPQVTHICDGESQVFTTNLINGGSPNFTWYKNGVTVGSGQQITIPNLHQNDTIRAYAAVSVGECHVVTLNGVNLRWDTVIVAIDNYAVPDLHINSIGGFCPGEPMSYTAVANNEGSNAHYIWMKNGIAAGTDTSYYLEAALAEGDIVRCKMITNGCSGTVPDTLLSNEISFFDSLSIPSVSIQLRGYGGGYCQTAYMLAIPVNTGPGATYRWKKNGVDISGASGLTPTISSVMLGDAITCVMSPNLSCRNTDYVSNPVVVTATTSAHWTAGNYNNQNVICPHTSLLFEVRANGNSLGQSYPNRIHWYKNGVYQSDGYTYNTGTGDTADYDLYYIVDGFYCWAADTSDVVHITVLNSPVSPAIKIVATPNTNCSGNNFTFSNAVSPPGSGGIWQWFQNGSAIYAQNTPSIAMSGLHEGDVISVRYTPGVANCSVSSGYIRDSVVIHLVNNSPSVTISTYSDWVCGTQDLKTFTAHHQYGGAYPAYQWKKNGVNVGVNSDSYTDAAIIPGDSISCMMISNNPCASPVSASSNTIVITAGSYVSAGVSISASQNNICAGNPATFTATAVNGGAVPTYQWKINGANAGTGSAVFTSSALTEGDTVSCLLYSNDPCVIVDTVASAPVVVHLISSVTPGVVITKSATDICSGTPVTFSSTVSGAGNSPHYQWMKNGLNVGTNSATYIDSLLNGSDQITCELMSSESCAVPATVVSNSLRVNVTPAVTPTLTLAVNPSDSVCAGVPVLFTAATTNGGGSPALEWLLNGYPAGNTTSSYQGINLHQGDIIACRLTSNALCVVPPTALSSVAMTVFPLPAKPVISPNEAVLTSNSVSGNQWYRNSAQISGAIQSTYTAGLTGWYQVEVTNSNGCKNISDSVFVNVTGVSELSGGFQFNLTPNPASDYCKLEWIGEKQSLSANILDLTGKTVMPLFENRNLSAYQFSTQNLPAGLYFVKVIDSAGRSALRKLVVQ